MAVDWKNEDEVKEYLENLAIEYRFQCFYEKRPDGCYRLGNFLEAVKKDYEKAAKVYKRNCDENNYGRSCYKYGGYAFLGRGGVKENKKEGFEYFKKGCDNNSEQSCFHAGVQLTSKKDKSIPKNYTKGLEYLDKACLLGYDLGCYYASGIYLMGGNEIQKDLKKAFHYSQKACELGNVYACANLSQMYSRGEGVEKNEMLGAEYKAKAMDLQKQLKENLPTIQFEQGV